MTVKHKSVAPQTTVNQPSASALALADGLASKIVEGAAPIQFSVAQSKVDREAVYDCATRS